jgi:hypothetical protein
MTAAKTNLNSETANSDTIMGEIMVCNQDPEKLESKLIIHASSLLSVISLRLRAFSSVNG